MKPKLVLKICVDIAMTVVLLLLMTYELIGKAAHEWIGVSMFVLLVLHHILNSKWSKNILKGSYTVLRILQTALVISVLLCMTGSMVSGVVLSRHAFAFLTIRGGQTADLLSFALQMAKDTDGALEPTIYPILTAWGFTTGKNRIPSDTKISALLNNVGYDRVRLGDNSVQLEDGMMLDLGAVGKGYSGNLVAQVLRENGITSALLDIGGNIQTVGTKPDGSPWRLGLRDPFSGGTLGVLEISNMAVVTSGNYERYFIGEDGKQYGHIIDPATGHPAETGLVSVTVISEEGCLCDALSTSLFVMGADRAVEYWRQHQNFDMILITEDGEIFLTDGIAEAFTLDSYHSNMEIKVIEHEQNDQINHFLKA